jgi:large subunit ribosomal protein L9
MRVILQENVGNLGNIGDVVTVKPGYGRNFLIPFGKAARATAANIEAVNARRADLERLEAEKLTKAEKRAADLHASSIKVAAKASEEGKLFGSVAAREIVEAALQMGVELHKSEVKLPNGPLRQTGEHEIDVMLHSKIHVSVKVIVEPEA